MSLNPYLPHTPGDIQHMLGVCSLSTLGQLTENIPESLRLKKAYNLPAPYVEDEVKTLFDNLGQENIPLTCFAGQGVYDRACPAAVADIVRRSEFLTAYTPYQPEISQGTLKYIFEYQSMMSALTGLPVSNASLYDGATATAEAMLMAIASVRRSSTVLISETVHQSTRRVVETYAHYHGVTIKTIDSKDGHTDSGHMAQLIAEGGVAAVIVQSPNRFGIVENYEGYAQAIHNAGALFAINTHAYALGMLKTPAQWGADIAVGSAQSLGMPMNYGGPALGYMCVTKALMRKMPGRIVGATTDARGQRVFVLTLQAREQHIRRQKATSNICSNQGIMTLMAGAYLSLVGAQGLNDVCTASHAAAIYLLNELEKSGAATQLYPGTPFIDEVALKLNNCTAAELIAEGVKQGILAGVQLDSPNQIAVTVTERRTPHQVDQLINLINTTASK